jgi:hypothetical protein
MKKLLLSFALLLGALGAAFAQQGALVQQSGSMLHAGVQSAVGTNFNTVNNTSTATINVPAGYFVYITGMFLSTCQDATSAAATNLNFTTTGLGSGAAAPQFGLSLAATANTCYFQPISFATPLKSAAAGTQVTVVSPAANLHAGFGITVQYYLAP